jgi:hypothetical protein
MPKLKMCSECGCLSDEELKPNSIACCPDSDFQEVPEKLRFWVRAHKGAYNLTSNWEKAGVTYLASKEELREG